MFHPRAIAGNASHGKTTPSTACHVASGNRGCPPDGGKQGYGQADADSPSGTEVLVGFGRFCYQAMFAMCLP